MRDVDPTGSMQQRRLPAEYIRLSRRPSRLDHLSDPRAHVVVAGGGFTGMVCALRLINAGYRVTLLEGRSDLGGLSASFDYGPFTWDRYYHCILPSDKDLLALLKQIGLQDEVEWTPTRVGFYSHDAFHDLTSPGNLFRYRHLTLWSKLRLAVGTLYVSKLRNGKRLERTPLLPWTERIFGKQVAAEFWEPLLRCKLGSMRHRASAAFLWATIVRLYSAREHDAGKQEKLGYVRGGYARVLRELEEQLRCRGVRVITNAKVMQVRSTLPKGGDQRIVEVETNQGVLQANGAILTLPCEAIARSVKTGDADFGARLREVSYLGLICVVLVLRRGLSPFYVTNITQQTPFTGVIEMTNLIDRETETAGHHLIYLPRYVAADDPLVTASDEDVWTVFRAELRKMYPDLKNSDFVARYVFRERAVQPVPVVGYAKIVPPTRAPLPYVFIANTAQIRNNTLNNNAAVGIADEACEALMHDVPVLGKTDLASLPDRLEEFS